MGLKASLNSIISKIGTLRAAFDIRVSAVWRVFDIKPVFFLCGIGTVGYGIYLNFSLGTALIFVGSVFMAVGYFMEARK